MERKVFILIISALMLFSCTPSKNTFEIETKLGTIVNQKWSEYKYKSHFKRGHSGDSNIEMYSRLVKDENGEYYIFTNDIYVRNDSVIWQGYNKSFDYDEFLQFDSLLLDCEPKNVIGDFSPEEQFMKRTYYFNSLDVEIQKSPHSYYIFFSSNGF